MKVTIEEKELLEMIGRILSGEIGRIQYADSPPYHCKRSVKKEEPDLKKDQGSNQAGPVWLSHSGRHPCHITWTARKGEYDGKHL